MGWRNPRKEISEHNNLEVYIDLLQTLFLVCLARKHNELKLQHKGTTRENKMFFLRATK